MPNPILSLRRQIAARTRLSSRWLLLAALFAAPLGMHAQAATVIASEAGPAHVKSLMTIDSGKARMQTEPENYILIDAAAGQYLYVAQESEQIVNMTSAPPMSSGRSKYVPSPVPAKLVNKGAGPKIAGYATQHYQLFANGVLCLNTYLSRAAMARGRLQEFLAGFSRLQIKQKQDYRAAGTQYPPCEDAQETLMARYPQLGLAMRTVGADGQLMQEVVSIKTGVTVSNNFFAPPPGFKHLTHEEFLRQMEGLDNAQPPAAAQGGTS